MADFLFDEGKNKIEGLNKTAINEALQSKADAKAVANAFQSVSEALDGKASTQALNEAVQGINTALDGKVDNSTFNEEKEKTNANLNTLNGYFSGGINLFNPNDQNVEVGQALNYDGTTSPNQSGCTSGYITIESGTYCYKTAPSVYGVNCKYIPKYNESHTPIGNITGSVDNDIVVFTINETTTIRLKLASSNYTNVMLVKSSTYPTEFIPYSKFLSETVKIKSTQIVPFNIENNPLYGKKIIFDGDSICHGTSVGSQSPYYGWGYAGRIGNKNKMDWHNEARSGATITHGLKFSDQTNRHWISSNIDSIYSLYPDADYIILEGGVNDADLLRNDAEKTGTVSQTKFNNFDYDIYAQALDYLFRNAINYFPNAKIGFIVAQKMGVETRYDSEYYRRAFFDMAIEACKKWSIPFIDLWNESGLQPKVPSQYTAGAETNLYTDGQHLTDLGYDFITPKIEAWIKTL